MTFKVQVDSDKYDRATMLLITTHAQITMLSIMYGNTMDSLEPSNEILANALMGFQFSLDETMKLLA